MMECASLWKSPAVHETRGMVHRWSDIPIQMYPNTHTLKTMMAHERKTKRKKKL